MVRGFEATAHRGPEVFQGRVEERAGDHPPRERGRGIDPAEPVQRAGHEAPGGIGVGEIAYAGDDRDGGTVRLELGHEPLGRVAEHEVVITLREQAGEGWPDVEAGVANQCDAAFRIGHRFDSFGWGTCGLPAGHARQSRSLAHLRYDHTLTSPVECAFDSHDQGEG